MLQQEVQAENSATDEATAPQAATERAKLPIELGLVLAGRLDAVDREAVKRARQRFEEKLFEWFPEFRWRVSIIERDELTVAPREAPVAFFTQGQAERDLYKLDFVFIVTNADLTGHDEPFALAAVSRTLDLAVLSTSRIDPRTIDPSDDQEHRVASISQRFSTLLLRCLGHLNGLEPEPAANNVMWDVENVDELDGMRELTPDQIATMRENLRSIADLRIEEQTDATRGPVWRFLLRVAWTQRREIAAGVMEAAPWQFPVRLSRLTTAVVSAMLVLLMTAETWDMSMNQSGTSVIGLILAAAVGTTAYVVNRQKLLVRRHDRLMTEQIAVSNLTSILTVLCGMVTTLAALFVSTLVLGLMMFPRHLVDGWAASLDAPASLAEYLMLSGVVSALSIAIGALGAAFEDQAYFRHVIFVDEEF